MVTALVAAPAIPSVTAASGATAAASGATAAAAVHGRGSSDASARARRALRSWGANTHGEVGDGTIISRSRPVRVRLPAGTTVISGRAGCKHSLALTSAGHVLAWGDNFFGQLGNDTTTASKTPVKVDLPAGTKVSAVRAGCFHSLALTRTGRVLAWGRNIAGELGNGSTVSSDTPVRVSLPKGIKVKAISAGCEHNLALTTTGQVLAWGFDSDGELGNGTMTIQPVDSPVMVKLPKGTKVKAIAAGCAHSLAITTGNRVLAWGDNSNGQLGDGTTTSRDRPVRVTISLAGPPAGRVTSLFAGCNHTLALTSRGRVLAWGVNLDGELGNGGTTDRHAPVRVALPRGTKVKAISAGCEYSLALTTRGRVLAWGLNNTGQLGDGSTTSRHRPVRAKLPAGMVASAIGSGPGAEHSMAIVHKVRAR